MTSEPSGKTLLGESAQRTEIPERHPESAAATPVLVIEDHDDVRNALATLFRVWGCSAFCAATGEQGVALAFQMRPTLAFIDLVLPDLSGYEVARRLRAHFGHAIRIVAWSAIDRDTEVLAAEQADFDDYVLKPSSPDELRGILNRFAGTCAS